MSGVFDFSANTLAGEPCALKLFEGQVLLIVNTASACGFTPQYKDLEELHRAMKPRGFSVLGFPSVFPGTRGAFPILRAGKIASYSPGPATDRETFLINTNVYSGDSGAPVFASSPNGKLRLLGLLTQRIGRKEGSVPLAVAINASVISETLKLEAAQQRAPGKQRPEMPFPAPKGFQPTGVRLLGPPGSLRKVLGEKSWPRLRLKPASGPGDSARPP